MSDLPLPEPTEPQTLDIQHDTDPEQDHGPARRIPHLGHAILFFALGFFGLALGLAIVGSMAHVYTDEAARHHPGVVLLGQSVGFLMTLAGAAWLFPRLWGRTFARGLEWNVRAVGRRWYWIVAAAVLLSFAAQGLDHLLPTPPADPLEALFTTPFGCWMTTLYGVLLAPVIEEIAFRGFLLPAIATGYDWLTLERTPAALRRWESSTAHSIPGLVFATLLSSAAFVAFHGPQLGFMWGLMGVLFGVSLCLSYVRIRLHSVACSVLLHATYNFTIFAVMLIVTGGYRHLDKLAH